MAGEISESVKKCVALLTQSANDTEKFAALFMITKLAKAKDCTAASKAAIFEAIGLKYLERLLLTDDVPVDCPPSIYKSLALSILHVFCCEPDLHGQLVQFIPIFLKMIQHPEDDCNLMAVEEAYRCLKGLATSVEGRQALKKANAFHILTELYTQSAFQSDEALELSATLLPESYPTSLLNKIALDFETDHDKRKFVLCNVLNLYLFHSPPAPSNSEQTWQSCLYRGLRDILQSKISAQQRDPALMLASTVLQLLGPEWIIAEDNSKPFFLLLVQLAAIEIRMQMDGKTFKNCADHKPLIIACFNILEQCMNYLHGDNLELEQKEKQTLYTGLKGAFTAIVNILLKAKADKNPPSDKLFLYATIRVLAAWLAQETSTLRTQVYQLLPFVLSTANETFYANRADRSATDVLRILLPGLCHLAVEEPSRKEMLNMGEDKVLLDVLQHHWTIAHYKRPPVPRSERLKVLREAPTEPELSPDVLADMQLSRAAMISTCNVLMNLTVLEEKYVERSATFNELMKFIFDKLPELRSVPENLVLHANLAVLGLLLLKQLSHRVKKDDFSICRYIQATIRFLWDAYSVDESAEVGPLVVSMAYKECWMELTELWFLGMQTMAAVIKQIPWISDFALESGWAEGITSMLRRVEIGALPPNVKSAFEDFLCHLVDANEEAKSVLKKADALRVCRNHRFMDLGQRLFGD